MNNQFKYFEVWLKDVFVNGYIDEKDAINCQKRHDGSKIKPKKVIPKGYYSNCRMNE